jgi:hypothetical protein
MQMTRQDLFVPQGFGLKAFPSFGGLDGLHISMKGPGCKPIDPLLIKLTCQRQISSRDLIEEDDLEEDELPSSINVNVSQLRTDRPKRVQFFNGLDDLLKEEQTEFKDSIKPQAAKNVLNTPKKVIPLLNKPSLTTTTKLDPPPSANPISNGTNNMSKVVDLMNFDDNVVTNNVNNIPKNDHFSDNNMNNMNSEFDPFSSDVSHNFNVDWGISGSTADPFAGFDNASTTISNTTSFIPSESSTSSSFTPSISESTSVFPPTPPSDYDPFEGLNNNDYDNFKPSTHTSTPSTMNITNNTSLNLKSMDQTIKPPKVSTNPFLKPNPLNYQKPAQNVDPFSSLSTVKSSNQASNIHQQQAQQRQQLHKQKLNQSNQAPITPQKIIYQNTDPNSNI